jgi:hypothetical protein
MDILAPKIGALHRRSQIKNCDFLDESSNDFQYISEIYEHHLPK